MTPTDAPQTDSWEQPGEHEREETVGKFQTSLKLTQDQTDDLAHELCKLIDTYRENMGILNGGGGGKGYLGGIAGGFAHASGSGYYCESGTWAWWREIGQAQYDNDFEWRKARNGGVFLTSNWSENISKRVVQQLSAKVYDDLLGTTPFFAAMPKKSANPQRAKQIEIYVQDAVESSNLRAVLKAADKTAFIRGECAVKLRWKREVTKFKRTDTVMTDASGQPIRLPNGQYVFEGDDTIPDPSVQNQFRLRKYPPFIMPQVGTAHFAEFTDLDQEQVDEGLEASVVYFKDFLFDIRKPIADSAGIFHAYDESPENLGLLYGEFEVYDQYSSWRQSEAAKPREAHGEMEEGKDALDKDVFVHEGYVNMDVDGDGVREKVFVILDYHAKKVVFADYMAKHMRRAPFTMLPGQEWVDGRSYGVGVFEANDPKQTIIDGFYNRVNIKASKEQSITCYHKDAFVETRANYPLVIGRAEPYELAPNTQYNDGQNPPIFRKNLAEVDEFSMKLREDIIQTVILEYGITAGGEASEARINSSKTATGVVNIQQNGNAIQKTVSDIHAKAIEEVLEMAVEIILDNMDESVAVYDPDTRLVGMLSRDEARHPERDVRLLLTRARSAEGIQMSQAARALVKEYYSMPLSLRKKMREFYVNEAKNYDVTDADTVFEEPTDDQIAEEAQAQGQPAKPPNAGVSAKLSDFAPSERSQIVQKEFQITPAQPQELAQHQAAQSAPNPVQPNGNGHQPAPGNRLDILHQ